MRKVALRDHVKALRAHVEALAKRGYAAAQPGDVDMVVLFLPSDSLLSVAFAEDPELQPDAWKKRVLIATPTTFVALLRTIAFSWSQRDVEQNAREISESARELFRRTATFTEHFAKVGKGLDSAVDAFNKAVSSYETRVVPQSRKLVELRLPVDGKELAPAAQIATRTSVLDVESA